MQFTHLVSSRPKSQTFKMALNKGINKFWTPWMLKCKRKLTCLVLSRNQEMKTSFIFKKSGLITSGVCGGKILHQKRNIKNDNQRLHFEELHASGMVHVCVSEAYAYVITSKQVLKSLCQLWAGSAYGLGLLRVSKCTVTPLLHEGGFIWPGACRSWQGLFTRGLQKVAIRHEFSYYHPAFFALFCYLHYAGKRREISKLKQQNQKTLSFHSYEAEYPSLNLHWNVPIYIACQRTYVWFSKFIFACLTQHPALLWQQQLWQQSRWQWIERKDQVGKEVKTAR